MQRLLESVTDRQKANGQMHRPKFSIPTFSERGDNYISFFVVDVKLGLSIYLFKKNSITFPVIIQFFLFLHK